MKILTPTILSLSLITFMATAVVAPTLGEIATAFPAADATLIKLVLTLPALFVVPFLFISDWLCRSMGKRKVLFIGLAAYLVGGLGGGLADTMTLLLFLRSLLGIGIGLIMPISIALVNDFYNGEDRVKMLGYVSAANQLGGVCSLMLAGWLASYSWRYSFALYLMGLVVAVPVYFHLPEPEPKPGSNAPIDKPPFKVWLGCGAVFGLMVALFSIPTNLALLLKAQNLGGADYAGMVIALTTVFGFFAGLVFVPTKKYLNKTFSPCMLALVATGFLMLTLDHGSLPIIAGVVLVGFGIGSLYPLALLQVTESVAPERIVNAMALVGSGLFLGQFLSPLIFDNLAKLLGLHSQGSAFKIAFHALAAAFLVNVFSQMSACQRRRPR